MSGRGCNIEVCVTKQNLETEIINLSVAVHSPLEVLQDRLSELTGIDVENQVLILCDLTDADRNNDQLLENSGNQTLSAIGIGEGSYLTLHSRIQVSANPTSTYEVQKTQTLNESDIFCLKTRISPKQADHSYNGIIFDIQSKKNLEVEVTSINVGGMLGRVRIYARDSPWEASIVQDNENNPHWWAESHSISIQGWECVADVVCQPSWDVPKEIILQTPIKLNPKERKGIYIHSGLPEDLGIQYQSFSGKHVIADQNEHIKLYPGLGHTGSVPFDMVHGWYRAYRGFAGSIGYKCKRKGWTIWEHASCPAEMQEGVRTMLLVHQRALNTFYIYDDLSMPGMERQISNTSTVSSVASDSSLRVMSVPLYLVYYILEFMDWEWFGSAQSRSRSASTNERKADEDEDIEQTREVNGSGKRMRMMRSGLNSAASAVYSTANTSLSRLLAILYAQSTNPGGISAADLAMQMFGEEEDQDMEMDDDGDDEDYEPDEYDDEDGDGDNDEDDDMDESKEDAYPPEGRQYEYANFRVEDNADSDGGGKQGEEEESDRLEETGDEEESDDHRSL